MFLRITFFVAYPLYLSQTEGSTHISPLLYISILESHHLKLHILPINGPLQVQQAYSPITEENTSETLLLRAEPTLLETMWAKFFIL